MDFFNNIGNSLTQTFSPNGNKPGNPIVGILNKIPNNIVGGPKIPPPSSPLLPGISTLTDIGSTLEKVKDVVQKEATNVGNTIVHTGVTVVGTLTHSPQFWLPPHPVDRIEAPPPATTKPPSTTGNTSSTKSTSLTTGQEVMIAVAVVGVLTIIVVSRK